MILNKILSWNKLSILGISLMLLNNISCIDYEDNVNPNEVTEEMMEVDNLKTGAFFSQMLRRVVVSSAFGCNVQSIFQNNQIIRPLGIKLLQHFGWYAAKGKS